MDPRLPRPPESPIPPASSVDVNPKGEVVETRRRIDSTPSFRKGALITDDEGD
jgi:hypothetical protein